MVRLNIVNNYQKCYFTSNFLGARGTKIEGITIANSAFHSLGAHDGYKPDEPILIRWVKIFTWRPNGDGIANLGNEIVEDCFIRTQDDSLYIASRAIRRYIQNLEQCLIDYKIRTYFFLSGLLYGMTAMDLHGFYLTLDGKDLILMN